MLRYFGKTRCPHCSVDMVHEYDLANDWVPPTDLLSSDQRWLCPSCGLSRPVIYAVERSSRATVSAMSARMEGRRLPHH